MVEPTKNGSTYVDPATIEWMPSQFDGIQVKVLYEDKAKGELTFITDIENAPLFIAILFFWLWRNTSPNSTYETVDLVTISTKMAFLQIAVILVILWLVIRFYV